MKWTVLSSVLYFTLEKTMTEIWDCYLLLLHTNGIGIAGEFSFDLYLLILLLPKPTAEAM